eukprot:747870-Hanusia_phi.AAC.10
MRLHIPSSWLLSTVGPAYRTDGAAPADPGPGTELQCAVSGAVGSLYVRISLRRAGFESFSHRDRLRAYF